MQGANGAARTRREPRGARGRVGQCGLDQCGVHVLGQLLELPIRNPTHPAIAVVIRLARFGGDATATLDDHVLPFGDEAMRGVGVLVGKLREQRAEQRVEHGLLALVRARPFGRPGQGPADILGQTVAERLAVAFRQSRKDLLHQSFVLGCAHHAFPIACRTAHTRPSSPAQAGDPVNDAAAENATAPVLTRSSAFADDDDGGISGQAQTLTSGRLARCRQQARRSGEPRCRCRGRRSCR
jgi:hypothetical protein